MHAERTLFSGCGNAELNAKGFRSRLRPIPAPSWVLNHTIEIRQTK